MRSNFSHPMADGITLIELIMTLAMVSVLVAIGTPGFGELMIASETRAAKSMLLLALNQARSSAVSRETHAVLCPSTNQMSCDDSVDWHDGWIVFLGSNRNDRRDPEEELLQVSQKLSAGVGLTSTLGRRHVTYRSDGSSAGSNLTFTFCDRRGPNQASSIIVNNAGRARQRRPTSAQAVSACEALQ